MQPHPTDIYVGKQIRKARAEENVTQKDLADALGLTFQQVQKYEKGANRVSASMLLEIAVILRRPIAWFFPQQDDRVKDFAARLARMREKMAGIEALAREAQKQ